MAEKKQNWKLLAILVMPNPKSKFSKGNSWKFNSDSLWEGGVGKEGIGKKKDNLIESIKFSETQLIKFSYYFCKVIFQILPVFHCKKSTPVRFFYSLELLVTNLNLLPFVFLPFPLFSAVFLSSFDIFFFFFNLILFFSKESLFGSMNNNVTQWWETCCEVQTASFVWFELLG